MHGLDHGATGVQVRPWAPAALAELIIIDLEKGQDELVEVRQNQAQLLVQGAGVGPTRSRPWLLLREGQQSPSGSAHLAS